MENVEPKWGYNMCQKYPLLFTLTGQSSAANENMLLFHIFL